MIKNDKTESEIFARIKQSLESYEEDYMPGSWEAFLQKRKRNNRKIFLRIASGIAACLLLGYAVFNFVQLENTKTLKTKTEQFTNTAKETPTVNNPSKIELPQSIASVKSSVLPAKSKGNIVYAVSNPKRSSIAARQENPVAIKPDTNLTANVPVKTNSLTTSIDHQPDIIKTDTIQSGSDTLKNNPGILFRGLPAPKENQNLAASKRKIRFGLNFSPGVNTNQSSNSMNYMAGISADISLFSNFQLSTGLQVENQSIVKNIQGIVASSSAPLNQTKTKLINLDLPVNLTWKFVSEKSHAYYVSAGLSSLVYLRQENKNTMYSQALTQASALVNGVEVKTYTVVDQISVTQNTVSPNQTFDFAGRINFMVGFEKKLSDKLFLHFEPYTKIPTSGQAPGSLNHTTTGINFKISF